ncbi:helix-turn-helix transcriptional regulator [Paenibacillus frigoriresistens]|uniref:helix-turn-helix domain-containing protein n=1 Tax=Paenibacillus alginolyticus TaxID=59839 RepID=UPI001567664A|nr:helix-turn-helix transcriptional regulator [Paenibacillus frigoriresistens]NRF96129.1 helix-turn-helix transcriptional regulator [Paenibacillus frigoriresistens]
MESYNQIRQWFIGLFREFFTYKNKNQSSFVELLVEQAQSVIRELFSDSELSVARIAKTLCITPNYLSKIFHEKTGLTCVEYITDFRLQEAKRLLAQTTRKTYEVAEAVGYDNSHYFSTIFKKKVLVMSPDNNLDYRIF